MAGRSSNSRAVGDVLPPAGQLLVDRFGTAQIALGHRHLVGLRPVDPVADAHRHGLQAGQHVEFGQEVVGDAVDPGGVASDDGVEPAAAPPPPGGDTELAAGLGQVFAVLVEQLGGERTRAHPGGVGLEDSQHGGDPGRADAGADGRAARRRIRRRHIRIGAVVDVEQGALRAFQQHRLAGFQRGVEQQPGVGDAMPETVGLLQQGLDHLVGFERLAVVDLDQDLVLELQRGLDLVGQLLGVEHVGHPDAHAGDLVLVAGSDAATGGADLLAAHVALGDLVDGHVVGHQQVRIGGDQQLGGVDAAVFQTLAARRAGLRGRSRRRCR